MESAPAVSVIISIHDAEKFIEKCLNSLLNQTMTDFEVILVNDCSTDGSRQIAELYLEKFGGRMKIHDNEKISGVGASRNKGLNFSCGEYIFFMDADDLIASTALEEMYTLAKENAADVVYCTKFYEMNPDGTETVLRNLSDEVGEIFIEEDIERRIDILLSNKFGWGVYLRLSRRSFLIDNQIFFVEDLDWGEDFIWAYGLLVAKKILHLPQAYYYSSTCKEKYYNQNLNVRYRAIVDGLKWIDDTLQKNEYFIQKPPRRHKVLENFTRNAYDEIFEHSLQTAQSEIYESLKAKFGKDFGEYDVLISMLLTLVNTNQKKIDNLKKKLS